MDVLTRKDYQAAIETCQYSTGSIGLKNFIDDFLKAYSSSNKDTLSTLMEYVLEVYPEVEDNDSWVNFHEKDYTNFNEEVSWYEQPQLQYLYSYLVYLSEKEFGLLDENGSVDYTPSKIKPIVVTNDDVSLKSDLSQEKLTAMCDALIDGTRIAGEELIYSIYKASFPEAKDLVESIGASFVPPSVVISLVARLTLAELNNDAYAYPLNVNEFRKRINNIEFKTALKKMIGDEVGDSLARVLFLNAFNILLSTGDVNTPPVLVKKLVKDSPDLFLMLLQWLKNNKNIEHSTTNKNILAAITALSWFGKNNAKYVREVWDKISFNNFWSNDILGIPFFKKRNLFMRPIIQPTSLRDYLLANVVEKNIEWNSLYPSSESPIFIAFAKLIESQNEDEEKSIVGLVNESWDNFMNNLFSCRSLVLFAQRQYINATFGDYNQMETLLNSFVPFFITGVRTVTCI